MNPALYSPQFPWYTLRFTGFSVYGGFLGALAALLLWRKANGIGIWRLLDLFVAPAGAAFVLARIGCFLEGCCAGRETTSTLGVVFPPRGSLARVLDAGLSGLQIAPAAVYPTQLLEAGLALFGLLPIAWLRRRYKPADGAAGIAYGLWFTAMRLAVFPLYPDSRGTAVYPALYAGLLLLGTALLFRLSRRGNQAARWSAR